MALSFPLSIAAFADLIPAASFRMWIERYVELSGTASGIIIASEIAAPKWKAEIGFAPMKKSDASVMQAMCQALGIGAGTFYLYDLRKSAPSTGGGGFGGQQISQLSGTELRLAGIPANRLLPAGTALSFDFGSSPVRRAYHVLTEPAQADGSGVTPMFSVDPPVKAGTTNGLQVTLYKPAAKMKVLAFDAGVSEGRWTTGMSLSAIEAI